jgi:transposase
MWTAKNRGRYDRSALRYPSDLTDDEWALVEPLIPPAKRGGNKRHVDVREVMNGMMYILSTGCQWRAIPKDLPPRSTVHDYLDLWSYDGTLYRIHHMLYVECREHHKDAARCVTRLTNRRPSASHPRAWLSRRRRRSLQ